MCEEKYQGVKIQKLPTIGEPLSIKTCKQGRVGTLSQNTTDHKLDLIGPNGQKRSTRSHRKKMFWKKYLKGEIL